MMSRNLFHIAESQGRNYKEKLAKAKLNGNKAQKKPNTFDQEAYEGGQATEPQHAKTCPDEKQSRESAKREFKEPRQKVGIKRQLSGTDSSTSPSRSGCAAFMRKFYR